MDCITVIIGIVQTIGVYLSLYVQLRDKKRN